MEKVRERVLRYLLNECRSDYQTLLSKSGFDALHLRRMKAIAYWHSLSGFKCINELNLKFISEMLHINKTGYVLRNEIILVQPKYNKVMYGYETFAFCGISCQLM